MVPVCSFGRGKLFFPSLLLWFSNIRSYRSCFFCADFSDRGKLRSKTCPGLELTSCVLSRLIRIKGLVFSMIIVRIGLGITTLGGQTMKTTDSYSMSRQSQTNTFGRVRLQFSRRHMVSGQEDSIELGENESVKDESRPKHVSRYWLWSGSGFLMGRKTRPLWNLTHRQYDYCIAFLFMTGICFF